MGEVIQFPYRAPVNCTYTVFWSWGDDVFADDFESWHDAHQSVMKTLAGTFVTENDGGWHYDIDLGGAATIKKKCTGTVFGNDDKFSQQLA